MLSDMLLGKCCTHQAALAEAGSEESSPAPEGDAQRNFPL